MSDNKDTDAFVGYVLNDDFSVILDLSEQVLKASGVSVCDHAIPPDPHDANSSGINLLARSAVASLLNAANRHRISMDWRKEYRQGLHACIKLHQENLF